MFQRITPVRCIAVLFLVYALSPLTSAFPVPFRHTAPNAPLVRLLLLDLVADLTAQPVTDAPSQDTDLPRQVLLQKRHAVLRRLSADIAPPSLAPALSDGRLVQALPWFARDPLRTHNQVMLAGARLPYVGLSPPA